MKRTLGIIFSLLLLIMVAFIGCENATEEKSSSSSPSSNFKPYFSSFFFVPERVVAGQVIKGTHMIATYQAVTDGSVKKATNSFLYDGCPITIKVGSSVETLREVQLDVDTYQQGDAVIKATLGDDVKIVSFETMEDYSSFEEGKMSIRLSYPNISPDTENPYYKFRGGLRYDGESLANTIQFISDEGKVNNGVTIYFSTNYAVNESPATPDFTEYKSGSSVVNFIEKGKADAVAHDFGNNNLFNALYYKFYVEYEYAPEKTVKSEQYDVKFYQR